MAATTGDRFHVHLSSDDEAEIPQSKRSQQHPAPALFPSFVKDISEKPVSAARLPQAPSGDKAHNGFPAHKKRTGVSKFKQSRTNATQAQVAPAGDRSSHAPHPEPNTPRNGESQRDRERRDIDEENRRRLAGMSDAEIEAERKELMQGMSSSLLERLLRRANIGEIEEPQDFPGLESHQSLSKKDADVVQDAVDRPQREIPAKRVAFAVPEQEDDDMPDVLEGRSGGEEEQLDGTGLPHPRDRDTEAAASIHFPFPPSSTTTTAPTLDPSSPSFLTDLHNTYYPDLPQDPSKTAWMADPALASDQSYTPSSIDVPISALRFSFTGSLIPPALSTSIPTTKGLHHHGAAPASAGYTVPELAHLARSSFPTQRCIAFQTIGRVLYRLGKGEFGIGGAEGETVERGLWACVREGRVLETLQEEVGKHGGHMSAKAYAMDALWLWRLGGGREPVELGAN